jgi:hypothetical protein
MAKRADILVESGFFHPVLEYQLFFKAYVIDEQ